MTLSIASLSSRLDDIESRHNHRARRHVTFGEGKTIIHGEEKDISYIPSPTGALFSASGCFVNLVMGPYGSGKSTMCVHRIIESACAMPAWSSGRRRSRWAIVRNTSGELQSTTLNTWLQWFSGLGDIRRRQKPVLTYEHQFNDGNGIVELEIIFIALDRPDDVRKIKSLELTGVYLNELSELPQNVLSHFKGRVNGRFPSRSFCPEPYWSGIIADTNPPDEDSWIYNDFEVKSLDNYRIFHQPPGLLKDEDDRWIANAQAENSSHLSPDYYTKLAEGQSEDFIKVFCLGKYGTVGTGRLVFPEFNADLHVVDHIDPVQGDPLYLGYDFGLTPACVVVQLSPRGRLLVLKEYVSHDMGIRSFAESVVIPGLRNDFPYNPKWHSVADPAGNSRNEIFEDMSCIGELISLGIETVAASTNDLEPRLAAIRYFLNKMVDGKPAFLLSRKACPTLFKGFARDYVYKRVAVSGEERFKDKPDKNMSSHPMDALGYRCMELASEMIVQKKNESRDKVDMFNPVFRWQN